VKVEVGAGEAVGCEEVRGVKEWGWECSGGWPDRHRPEPAWLGEL